MNYFVESSGELKTVGHAASAASRTCTTCRTRIEGCHRTLYFRLIEALFDLIVYMLRCILLNLLCLKTYEKL